MATLEEALNEIYFEGRELTIVVWANTTESGSPILGDLKISFPKRISHEQFKDIIRAINKVTPICLLNNGSCRQWRITENEEFLKKQCEGC